MTKVAPELTTKQAAELLGMSEYALRRRLQAMRSENSAGAPPKCGNGPRAEYRLTEPWLRRHMPDRFSRRDELAAMVEEKVQSLEKKIAQQDDRIEELAAMIAEVLAAVDATSAA